MVKILIADDHPVVCRGLKEILVHELKDVVCDEAEGAQEALVHVQKRDWDLVILDITMQGRSGLTFSPTSSGCGPSFPC